MSTWKEVSKARLICKDYAVFGYRLYNMDYYGPEDMWDTPDPLPLDRYMLRVCNWYSDRWGSKSAGEASPVKFAIFFDDKEEANKMWLYLKKQDPTLEEVKKIPGFKKD